MHKRRAAVKAKGKNQKAKGKSFRSGFLPFAFWFLPFAFCPDGSHHLKVLPDRARTLAGRDYPPSPSSSAAS
jgi:hypothetical protein